MRRYLLVDDNGAFAENLAEILRDHGAEVVVATGGAQALALTRATRFDAAITDMRMPAMSGAALVHELRRVDPELPAVVVTAYIGDDDLRRAREEGLLAILPKPVPVPRLIELLAAARRDALVALIEDDPRLSDNLCEALRDRGFSTVTARTLVETERLSGVRPFAALVDLRLPGGPDGAAMRRIAASFPGLPMLVITAYADVAPPLDHGGLFAKPFDTGQLLAALERLYASRWEARP